MKNINLAEMRKKAGYSSQEQLATELEIPRSTLAKWEAGICEPSIKTFQRLAAKFNCTVDELLSESGEETV